MKNKKLIPLFTFALFFCCLALAAPANTEAKTVKLNNSKKVTKASMKMNVGQKKKIKLKNVKSGKKIKWKSSNSKVVKIKKQKGNTVKIKAKKKGTATVTGKIGKKKVKVKVKVGSNSSTTSYTMAKGDTKWLKGPSKSGKVKWSTSNSKVVKITSIKSGKAKIKCASVGTATVTGKLGKEKCTYKIKVLSKLDYALQHDWRTASFKKETKKVVKEVLGSDYSKYTDAQKCYKLAMWECNYLEIGSENELDSMFQRCGETALEEGYGNTQSYAELYDSLLREAGVQSLMIYESSYGDWNLVYIDGKTYNCDIIRMDGGSEERTSVLMEDTFLCSDSAFQNVQKGERSVVGYNGYNSFTLSVPKCTSTKYDDKKYLIGQSDSTHSIEITKEEYDTANGDSNPYYDKTYSDTSDSGFRYWANIDYTSNIFTRGEV